MFTLSVSPESALQPQRPALVPLSSLLTVSLLSSLFLKFSSLFLSSLFSSSLLFSSVLILCSAVPQPASLPVPRLKSSSGKIQRAVAPRACAVASSTLRAQLEEMKRGDIDLIKVYI